MDDLKRPVAGPGCGSCRRHVRDQNHVGLGETFFAGGFAPPTRNGLKEDRVWQVELLLRRELRRGHRLAACNAGEIRNDAFDLVETMVRDIFGGSLGKCVRPVSHCRLL